LIKNGKSLNELIICLGDKMKNKSIDKSNKCVICDSESKDDIICSQCSKEKERAYSDLPLDRSKKDIKNHYFNLKEVLYNVQYPENTKYGMARMMAISEELFKHLSDEYLKKRVQNDIQTLRKKQKERIAKVLEGKTITIDDKDFRKQFLAEHLCEDGHYVRSKSEMLIDNWFYSQRISYAYEKSVFMSTKPDAIVISDFYIPDGDVYIEFWGISDEDAYSLRKKKKQELYRDNSINLIELEQDSIKRLSDIMPRKLHEYIPNKKFR